MKRYIFFMRNKHFCYAIIFEILIIELNFNILQIIYIPKKQKKNLGIHLITRVQKIYFFIFKLKNLLFF